MCIWFTGEIKSLFYQHQLDNHSSKNEFKINMKTFNPGIE